MTTSDFTYIGKPFSSIIWMAIILHFGWAFMLLFLPIVVTTPMALFYLTCGGNPFLMATVLMLSSICGWISITGKRSQRFTGWLFLLPQQFLLILSGLSSLAAVLAGQYADGVPRPWYFILEDQLANILLPMLHTVGLLRWHGAVRRWKLLLS